MTKKEQGSTNLAPHVDALLKEHHIGARWSQQLSGRAWPKARVVRLPLITSERRYALAMHEIGHIVADRRATRLERELDAWVWAERNAIVWTNDMRLEMRKSLSSYIRWATRRRGLNLVGLQPLRDAVAQLLA